MKQPNFKKTLAAATLSVMTTFMTSTTALAFDFKAGDVDVTISGFLNGYYTHVSCSGNQGIIGLAIAGKGLGCGNKDGATNIGNGLLPNAIVTSFSTRQNGLDIGGAFMVAAAISSADAISNNNNVDIRKSYLTIGTTELGTFKIGRDYGLFGLDAILGDMTLLGVGSPVQATQRNRVSLGHIGAGTAYAGTYSQISYKSPTINGITFNGGLFGPIDSYANTYISKNQPQLQLHVNYAGSGFNTWAGIKTQKFYSTTTAPDFTMSGFELGGTLALGNAGLLVEYQNGRGLGILADGDTGDNKQQNLMLQGTYKITPVDKLGVSYGISKMKDGTGLALKDNNNITLGLYHNLTPTLTLVAEVIRTESKPFSGEKATSNGVALGAFLFF